jgi:hypothetical protein
MLGLSDGRWVGIVHEEGELRVTERNVECKCLVPHLEAGDDWQRLAQFGLKIWVWGFSACACKPSWD